EKLLHLVETEMTDADFSPATVPLQAHPVQWRADETNGVIVLSVATKAEAKAALKAIAEQGEGSEMPPAGAPLSHFEIFVRLFRERRDTANDPATRVAQVPDNPNTSPPPAVSADTDEAAAG